MLSYCIIFLQRLFGRKKSSPIITSATPTTNPLVEPLVEPLVAPVVVPESVLEPFPEGRPEACPEPSPEVSPDAVEIRPINPKDDPLYYVDPTIKSIPIESVLEEVPILSITPIDEPLKDFSLKIEEMD